MTSAPRTGPIASFEVPWELRQALLTVLPDGWAVASYGANIVGTAQEHRLAATRGDGVSFRIGDVGPVAKAAADLRRAESTPDDGPWFSLSVELRSDGTGMTTRVYGLRPDWEGPVPSSAYAEDLRLLPRVDAAIPDWLRAEAEAASSAPAELRHAKVFDGTDPATGVPIVNRTGLTPEEAQRVLGYLDAGPVFLFARSFDKDIFYPENPPAVPLKFATDGTWIWSGAVAYYLEKYRMPPEDELLAHIRALDYTLPEVTQEARDAAREQMTGGAPGTSADSS